MATLGYPYPKDRQKRYHVHRKKLRLFGEIDFHSAVKTMNNAFEEDLRVALAEQEAKAKKKSNAIIAHWDSYGQSNAVEMEQKKTGQELAQQQHETPLHNKATQFTLKEKMSNKNEPPSW
eukprot:720955-Rhodomonas_salina.1